MFTKYNMNIPQNYSGNRFKQPITETEMKTHRATDPYGVKTSVSPLFKDTIDTSGGESQAKAQAKHSFEEEIRSLPNEDYEDALEEADDSPAFCEGCESKQNEKESAPHKGELFGFLKSSGILELISKASNEDLLIMGLIVLLATDSSQQSLDTIIILALLLMYH